MNRSLLRAALAAALLAPAAVPEPVVGQAGEGGVPTAPDSTGQFVPPPEPERGPWWTLWSWPTPHDRLIVGMITTHLYELDEAPTNNDAIGLVYRGLVGATFITTHGPRGFAVAFERAWLEGEIGPIRTMLGFRTGLVYGYDGRLFELADHTPILPYGQPVLLARAGPVTLDFTYTWVVVSMTAGVTLW